MTELKHADVIVHMAKHGLESVQFRRGGDETWVTLEDHYRINPLSSPNCEWRIKPATITYTVTVPEPMLEIPKVGDVYWAVSLATRCWIGDVFDNGRFKRGNIWDTEAKAQQAFDALFGPLKASKQ